MRELTAISGIAGAAAPGPEGFGSQPLPRPAPVHAASAVGSLASAAAPATPAVHVNIAGLTLEAVVWPRGELNSAAEAPNVLRGMVSVVPVTGPTDALAEAASGLWATGAGRTVKAPSQAGIEAGSTSGTGGRAAASVAMVVGHLGSGALLLESDGQLIVLRGGSPQLPEGARVLLTWLVQPEPVQEPMPEPRAVAAAATGAASAVGGPAGTAAHLGEVVRESAQAAPEEAVLRQADTSARAGGRAPVEDRDPALRAGAAAGTATAPAPKTVPIEPVAQSFTTALIRLAALFGFSRELEEQSEGRARDRRADAEEGRGVIELDFPALGRVRLEIAWSPRSIDLRLSGSPLLAELDREDIVRAFTEGLALVGGRGRILVCAHRSG